MGTMSSRFHPVALSGPAPPYDVGHGVLAEPRLAANQLTGPTSDQKREEPRRQAVRLRRCPSWRPSFFPRAFAAASRGGLAGLRGPERNWRTGCDQIPTVSAPALHRWDPVASWRDPELVITLCAKSRSSVQSRARLPPLVLLQVPSDCPLMPAHRQFQYRSTDPPAFPG